MFTTYAEGFYDPDSDALELFYGPAENPEPDREERCAECDAPIEHEVGGSFCTEDCGHGIYFEPDPDAQLEEYHWRLSSL